MDIVAVQKILTDAIKEYELTGNLPAEVLVSFISVDIYRKLNAGSSKVSKPKSPGFPSGHPS